MLVSIVLKFHKDFMKLEGVNLVPERLSGVATNGVKTGALKIIAWNPTERIVVIREGGVSDSHRGDKYYYPAQFHIMRVESKLHLFCLDDKTVPHTYRAELIVSFPVRQAKESDE